MKPSFRSASRSRNKGRNQLVRLAIRHLHDGNAPEALGCLLAYEQKRKAAGSADDAIDRLTKWLECIEELARSEAQHWRIAGLSEPAFSIEIIGKHLRRAMDGEALPGRAAKGTEK